MIWILMFFLSYAQAGFLRIDGRSEFQLERKGDSLEFRGLYTIRNDGDEEAKEVFPELILDQYQWIGYPRDIAPGEDYVWEFRKKLTAKDLCLKVSEKCPLALPMKGQFFVQIQKHYQDKNGYIFVVPDMTVINLGAQDHISPLSLELKVLPEASREYRGEYQLKSQAAQDLKVSLRWMLPREMESLSEPLAFEIPTEGEVAGQFLFRNRSALPGSNYVVVAVTEWVENGERRVETKIAPYQVEKPKTAPPFFKNDRKVLAWLLWATFFGLIWMWIFWIRPEKKLR